VTQAAPSDKGRRGLGVDEATVRSWEERGLIRAHVLPTRVRPIDSRQLAKMRNGSLTGFPEPHEEELPAIHVRGFAED
jgi:hypothetical protein